MGNKNIITLITDFGDESGYAGVMKGVILTINPECQIIDITHRVSPQDIEEAAFLLNNAYPYFPAHTIHVVVVDPGVGSERKPILVETDKYWFVGPDNGVFSFVFSTKEIKSVREITNTDYYFSEVSSTFHGRDIFAPVAGYLSLGVSAGKIGSELQKYVVLADLEPKVSEGAIKGRVVYVDRFGNLISNISKGLFNRWIADNPFELTVGKRVLHRLSRSYADAGEAEILALFGSSRWLEISVKNGNCQKELGLNKGAEVTIYRT